MVACAAEWNDTMSSSVINIFQNNYAAGESPEFIRTSLAAAMTLGLKPGLFYRDAKLYCINLLLTYQSGCTARCAYCGLSHKRSGAYRQKSFIRVTWPTYPLEDIITRIAERRDQVTRICISMVTNKRSVQDTKDICVRLRSSFDMPVSLLICPTLLRYNDLLDFRKAGADKVGVAIDLATAELFNSLRGSGIGGPHSWDTYWRCLENAITVFGKGNAGSHFMVGTGETEREMCAAIQRVRDMGGRTHLFSFYPEENSAMAEHLPPPMGQYRRIQVARFLIDNQMSSAGAFAYDDNDRVIDFGVSKFDLDRVIDSGEPFRTSGCQGHDGQVACNRPYANSRPGPLLRNYPFPPNKKDVMRIRKQLVCGAVPYANT